MKKFISVFLAVSLILCSFSFVFADFTSIDSTNLYNTYQRVNSLYTIINNTMPTFNQVSTVNSNLSDIYSRLGTINTNLGTLSTISSTLTSINSKLSSGNYTIASLTESILNWMRPIYNAINAIPVDIEHIDQALWKNFGTANEVSYLSLIAEGLPITSTVYGVDASSAITSFTSNNLVSMLNNMWTRSFQEMHATGSISKLGTMTLTSSYNGQEYTYDYKSTDDMIKNGMYELSKSQARITAGYNDTQTALDWTDIEDSISSNPTSTTNGLYFWLSNIQAPIARLSYVLASDERIAAQEAAAANEEAVVDNFIDHSGSGAASTNDIGAVSDLSAGYKDSFGSDASVSGIFDIFDSDHMGWFSNETKNQLDTTSNQRSKSSTFETPLLDKQIQDIYDSLGVKMP